jgi:FixJ family two-component response regulator
LAERPGLRVLYMSGHGLDVATRRGMVEGSALLEKPFSTETLSFRVREALDRPVGRRRDP